MISSAEAYRRRSSRVAHPVEAAVVVQRLVRPTATETEALAGRRRMNAAASARAVVAGVAHQHPRRPGVRLDVVRVEAEPLEADEVMDRLPDDARHRDLGHHPEHDDLRASAVSLRLRPAPIAGGRRRRVTRAAAAAV